MAKKYEKEEVEEVLEEEMVETPKGVQPITQEFGNGDLNLLRDKINELIGRP